MFSNGTFVITTVPRGGTTMDGSASELFGLTDATSNEIVGACAEIATCHASPDSHVIANRTERTLVIVSTFRALCSLIRCLWRAGVELQFCDLPLRRTL